MNGDGFQTIPKGAGTFFDYNRNGFLGQTGWVGLHDGLLVMDRNGNGVIDDGSELFGDQTILLNGKKAINAFQALAELDGNSDGKIDANDKGFSQLRVLRYSDQGSETPAGGLLYTLDELGISSINLASTTTGITDPQGNIQNRIGSFERTDGTLGQIAEYTFQQDPTLTIAKESLSVPDEVAALPRLQGYGVVYDLPQAIVRDTSGQLKSLVEQFAAAATPSSRNQLMEQILSKWAGTERLPQERSISVPGQFIVGTGTGAGAPIYTGTASSALIGNFIGVRNLGVLEHFYGQAWVGVTGSNPTYEEGVNLNNAYSSLFEMMYAELMAQTHLKDLYAKVGHTWDDAKQEYRTNFTDVIPVLVAGLNQDPVEGRQDLSEFTRMLRGLSSCSPACYLTFREHMLEIDPSLALVFDTGGLPVFSQLHQGTRSWSPHIEGTDNADFVVGSLTQGDRYINGLNGDDVIYGTSRNEVLITETGDSLLVAGGGNDQIWAGAGNDILDGGEGNDLLKGEAGNDTYIFRRGSGQDTIIDTDATAGNIDTIWLGSNLTPEDITLRRSENNIVLRINDTDDTLTIKIKGSGLLLAHGSSLWPFSDNIFCGGGGSDTIYAMAA